MSNLGDLIIRPPGRAMMKDRTMWHHTDRGLGLTPGEKQVIDYATLWAVRLGTVLYWLVGLATLAYLAFMALAVILGGVQSISFLLLLAGTVWLVRRQSRRNALAQPTTTEGPAMTATPRWGGPQPSSPQSVRELPSCVGRIIRRAPHLLSGPDCERVVIRRADAELEWYRSDCPYIVTSVDSQSFRDGSLHFPCYFAEEYKAIAYFKLWLKRVPAEPPADWCG